MPKEPNPGFDKTLRFKQAPVGAEYRQTTLKNRLDFKKDIICSTLILMVLWSINSIIELFSPIIPHDDDPQPHLAFGAIEPAVCLSSALVLSLLINKSKERINVLLELLLFIGVALPRIMNYYTSYTFSAQKSTKIDTWFLLLSLFFFRKNTTVFLLHFFTSSLGFFVFSRRYIEYPPSILAWAIENVSVAVVLYILAKFQRLSFLSVSQLREERVSSKLIFERIPDGLLIIDKHMHTQMINPVLSALFGIEKDFEEETTKSILIENLKNIKNIKVRQDRGIFSAASIMLNPTLMKLVQSPRSALQSPQSNNRDIIQGFSDLIFDPAQYSNLYEILSHAIGSSTNLDIDAPQIQTILQQSSDYMIVEGTFKNDQDESLRTLEITFFFTIINGKTCVVLILKDVTKRDIVTKLEENDAYRGDVLSSISHELRTPLNGAIGLTQCALNDIRVPDDCKASYLQPSLNSCKLLLSMINTIIDYTELKSNSLMLDCHSKEIKKTILETINIIRNQAELKKIEVKIDYDEEIPRNFSTDHRRLSQILIQLLTNAVKFTYKGSITISVKKNTGGLRIAVIDTGIGMEPSHLQELEMSFKKLSIAGKLNENSIGCGLGLYLANELAKRLGAPSRGGLMIESRQHKGSKFLFVIEEKSDKLLDMSMDGDLRSSSGNNSYIKYTDIDIHPYTRTDHGYMRLDSRKEHSAITSHTHTRSSLKISPFGMRYSKDICKDEASNIEADPIVKSECEIAEELIHSLTPPVPKSTKNNTNVFKLRRKGSMNVARCRCRSLLIVDDDPFNTLALEQLLLQYKLSVDIAFNGKDGVSKFEERRKCKCCLSCTNYKVIFMDFNMPIMDGLEATKKIRKLCSGEVNPPVIIGCTAFGANNFKEAEEAGMDECYQKPLKKEDLDEILGRYYF